MLMLGFFLTRPMAHRFVSLAVRVTFGLVVTVLNVRSRTRRTRRGRAHLVFEIWIIGLYGPAQASHTRLGHGLLGSVLGLWRSRRRIHGPGAIVLLLTLISLHGRHGGTRRRGGWGIGRRMGMSINGERLRALHARPHVLTP